MNEPDLLEPAVLPVNENGAASAERIAAKNWVYSLLIGGGALLNLVAPFIIDYLAPRPWRRNRWRGPTIDERIHTALEAFYEPAAFFAIGALVGQCCLAWLVALGTSRHRTAAVSMAFTYIAFSLCCTWIGLCLATTKLHPPASDVTFVVLGIICVYGGMTKLFFWLNGEELVWYSEETEIVRHKPRLSIGFFLLMLTSCGLIVALATQGKISEMYAEADVDLLFSRTGLNGRIARMPPVQIAVFWLLILQQAAITAGMVYAMSQLVMRNRANWVGGVAFTLVFACLFSTAFADTNKLAVQNYVWALLGLSSLAATFLVTLRFVGWRLEYRPPQPPLTLEDDSDNSPFEELNTS